MKIQLNFINNSNDKGNSQVVLFQKNVAGNFDESAAAWRVIQSCGQGDNHPFDFPMAMPGSAIDSGAVNAWIYRDGKLQAAQTGLAPQQKAVFEFQPTLWIGVAPDASQGQAMDPAIVSDINTELSLLGVASADIVMTGGGPGADSPAFAFHLENVVMA